jgi:predicted ATPase
LATAESGAGSGGLEDMRRGVELLRGQNILTFDGLIKLALAEAEARTGDVERALAVLAETLATCERTGHRSFEAELHRVRGEMLLNRDPADPATAEEALQTAIAVAKRQGTRSFELRAALALAKLYQSTSRSTEAHAVLAPALKGFSPTAEMPEIAEALALLAALVEMDEVKAEAASKRRRFELQWGYRVALAWNRGNAAEETRSAAARTDELAAELRDPAARFALYPMEFFASFIGGETGKARSISQTYLEEATNAGALPDVALASVLLGEACWAMGAFSEARRHLLEAFEFYDRAPGIKFESIDWTVYGTLVLAAVYRHLGDAARARELIEKAKSLVDADRGVTFAITYTWTPFIEALRGDARAVLRDTEKLAEISAKLRLPHSSGVAKIYQGWARARLDDHQGGLEELRQGLAQLGEQKALVGVPFYQGLLAELEAEGPGQAMALPQIDEALALAEQTGQRATDALLHRIRGDILLKADPNNPARAEGAYVAAIAIAREQGARSFGLRAALALAKLYRSTCRPIDAHAVLAPALEGFGPPPLSRSGEGSGVRASGPSTCPTGPSSPALLPEGEGGATAEMPEIAEALALLAALAETDEVKANTAQRERRLHFQTAYGQAMMWSKGFAAQETSDAFARSRELAGGTENPAERFPAYYAQWVRSLARGEHRLAEMTAQSFLRDAEEGGYATEAGFARRCLGASCYYQGKLLEARTHLERAFADYRPDRDIQARFRFGYDTGILAAANLAATTWRLGQVKRARQLAGHAVHNATKLGHVPSSAFAYAFKTSLEIVRDDPAAALPSAETLLALAREHGMGFFVATGEAYAGWARGRLSDPEAGAQVISRVLAEHFNEANRLNAPWLRGLLAELEVEARGPDIALALIDQGLAISQETEERFSDPYLYRLRGDILLRRDAADPAPAEEAFKAAIAIAKQQRARSYELLASLSLAKLCQSTGRPIEARAVLAPALEGFVPTPEMPEIAEAEALLAALAETGEVKAAGSQRQRRLDLQTSYGQALIWGKGFAAEETEVAFARASEFAGSAGDGPARLVAYYAQCLRGLVRGEYAQARGIAEAFLREAEAYGRATEAAAARRMLGLILLNQGELKSARSVLERALGDIVSQPDGETQFLFDWDTDGEASAAAYLALAEWHLGELERARQLIQRAIGRADKLGHVATVANVLFFKTVLESRRDDVLATQQAAEALLRLAKEHGIKSFADMVQVHVDWTHGRLVDPEAGAAAIRLALAAHVANSNKGAALSHHVLLAELEANSRNPDNALTLIGKGLAIAEEIGGHLFDPCLHRLRGDILLKRDPANPAPAEEAFQTAIALAKRQGARSFELRAALALAKLYQSTGRPVEAHAVLAPALEGFSPTPEMQEIAEAQALLARLAETDEVKAAIAQRERRLRLQTVYGQAMMWTKGYAAEETRAAYSRIHELGGGTETAERFAAHFAQWVRSYMRAELSQSRATAEAFLREAEEGGYATEAGAARRILGSTRLQQGDFKGARILLERVLADYLPERDAEARFRFAHDIGVSATADLAIASWCLGEVERARQLTERAVQSARESGHIPTGALAITRKTMHEVLRGDAAAALCSAETLLALVREHEMVTWIALGELFAGWARGRLDDPKAGAQGLRRALSDYLEQGNKLSTPLFHGMLAEVEAEARGADAALARIDQGLAISQETGERRWDAYLYRLRGHILLNCEPAEAAPAEEACRTAIAIAKEQGARSYELLASLSLAKLYQSTGRPADAHAVLAPALEGFALTSEMPEIAEAQALLGALAQMDEVKADAAQHGRRLHLQTTYGQAVMWSKGFAAEETRAAFARASELAGGTDSAIERFPAYYAQWVRSVARAEHRLAERTAESFLWEAEEGRHATEAGFARRCLGASCYYQGKLLEARTHLERALADYRPDRDAQARFRFGYDTGVLAAANLITTSWHLGQVERARQLAEQAVQRATELGHVPTGAFAHAFKTSLEIVRDDPVAALRSAETLLVLAREHEMEFFVATGEAYAGWARGRLDNPEAGAQVIRRTLAEHFNEANSLNAPWLRGLLAELEAATHGPDAALTLIDQGLTISQETGERFSDPCLHRLRGEILLERDQADPAPAEEALKTAIAIAKQQGARSYELLASLSLAKLYQSTGRSADAHSVLAPALKGFSPTAEMPEIAEAQALLAELRR